MLEADVPIFPLRTVLYPGGPLPLRIFEPRYSDMVGRCMKQNSGFGVVAIREGREDDRNVTVHDVGTVARIVDWYQERDGLLGIVAVGIERFRLHDTSLRKDGLRVGNIETVGHEKSCPVPVHLRYMCDVMESIIDQLGDQYALIDRDFGDAGWLSNRFAEILPISLEDKQLCLEMLDPLERLNHLVPVLATLRSTE